MDVPRALDGTGKAVKWMIPPKLLIGCGLSEDRGTSMSSGLDRELPPFKKLLCRVMPTTIIMIYGGLLRLSRSFLKSQVLRADNSATDKEARGV